jgi:hypothetical protein
LLLPGSQHPAGSHTGKSPHYPKTTGQDTDLGDVIEKELEQHFGLLILETHNISGKASIDEQRLLASHRVLYGMGFSELIREIMHGTYRAYERVLVGISKHEVLTAY